MELKYTPEQVAFRQEVRAWMQAEYPDIRHFVHMPRGGHFAAFEQPVLFVDDLRTYFRLLR